MSSHQVNFEFTALAVSLKFKMGRARDADVVDVLVASILHGDTQSQEASVRFASTLRHDREKAVGEFSDFINRKSSGQSAPHSGVR